MKCHKCQSDNKAKDRTDGRCSRCSHQFVFDPYVKKDAYNDIQFQKSLELISMSGSLKFTKRQFYYFMNRRKLKSQESSAMGCALFIGIIFLILVFTTRFNQVFIGLTIFYFLVGLPITMFRILKLEKEKAFRPPIKWTKTDTDNSLARWEGVNGLISGVLPDPAKAIPASADVPKEVLDYSFDRLIVTQSDEIAHFLIANNFHFENNCAVLSINQYPGTLFHVVMKMLRNNESLKVYALHDASWDGLKILDKLRTDKLWFADQPSAQIIDLGLMPRQVENRVAIVEETGASTLRGADELSSELRSTLTEKELQFLKLGIVRADSIAPQALLRMITAGIAMSRDPSKKDALVPIDSGSSSSGGDGGGIYIFSADSFG